MVRLGIYLEPGKGWHTYWTNPGDSGGPATIKLNLPEGWKMGTQIWPTPERLALSGTISYGYRSPVLVIVPVAIPKTASRKVEITGKVRWLSCTNEMCKPEGGTVSLSLALGPRQPSKWKPLFDQTLALKAKTEGANFVSAEPSANGVELKLENFQPKTASSNYYFFPSKTGILDHSKPEKFFFQGSTLIGQLPKSPYAVNPPKRITGVLVAQDGASRIAYAIDVSLQKKE